MKTQPKKIPTRQAIIDRHQYGKFAVPTEITRTQRIINPPSIEAQKLFKYMIQQSGKHITEDKTHSFFLSDLNDHDGFSHHDRKSLEKLFEQLTAFILVTTTGLNFHIGTMLTEAHSADTLDGKILISYEFGTKFKKMVKDSQLYTIIDASAVFKFKHAHTMQLYDYIAAVYKIPTYKEQKLSLLEFKELLGIPDYRYPDFFELHRKVIIPSINDLNQNVESFSTSYQTIKTGKKVTHIILSWKKTKSKQDQITDQIKQTTENLNSYKPKKDHMKSFHPSKNLDDPWRIHCLNILGIQNFTNFKINFPKWLKYKKLPLDHPNIIQLAKQFAETEYHGT